MMHPPDTCRANTTHRAKLEMSGDDVEHTSYGMMGSQATHHILHECTMADVSTLRIDDGQEATAQPSQHQGQLHGPLKMIPSGGTLAKDITAEFTVAASGASIGPCS